MGIKTSTRWFGCMFVIATMGSISATTFPIIPHLNIKTSLGLNNVNDFKVFLAVINDNNTGNVERGQKGQYIGPDDFLTVSVFFRLHLDAWRLALTYNDVTSRKEEYRYDLIFGGLSKRYESNGIVLKPELGLVWKGDCGGDEIQNGFHRMKDLPELFVPYCDGGLAAFAAAMVSKPINLSHPFQGILTSSLEVRLISDLVPSRLSPMLGYQAEIWPGRLQVELLAGARLYINEIDEYSHMVRSGAFTAVNAKFRVYQNFYFDTGIAVFPAQNLENDPIYKDKDHSYIPQINMVFSWNSAWYGLYNYLEY
ncbi:MAG: hypothetical protein HOD43_01875 [Candidatus Marinimicrobia bacterium]|jgi:hypothetical protein|nr:hypothetical protein [Candidatus Neomarinimicrobiota bacterium]MBT3631484.1 hypothetical protein [Candidatus Neomarinimicrobiota bacterium]MBT3823820.1 hypothetical protein [Candidatus Neomarinimicrobiota bacterium]MBT4129835.1 hypothetical protein [Candidatus Neomarinimicrobiota bacterium]MBT4294536.1 hypothetical protein [Candidatus Neomarinimicrobiota bacterium]